MILSRFKLVAFPETFWIGFYTKTLNPVSVTALESVTVPRLLACVTMWGQPPVSDQPPVSTVAGSLRWWAAECTGNNRQPRPLIGPEVPTRNLIGRAITSQQTSGRRHPWHQLMAWYYNFNKLYFVKVRIFNNWERSWEIVFAEIFKTQFQECENFLMHLLLGIKSLNNSNSTNHI